MKITSIDELHLLENSGLLIASAAGGLPDLAFTADSPLAYPNS